MAVAWDTEKCKLRVVFALCMKMFVFTLVLNYDGNIMIDSIFSF